MINGLIQQEGVILVNMYAPNKGAPKYVKQLLMDIKGEINRNTVKVGDFNTPLTSMHRSSRQIINKERVALNDTIHQMNLIDIFRVLHSKATEYTDFSIPHVTFSRIEHMLGHKTNLSKCKNIEIISSMFSDKNAMKLEDNHKKNTEKHTKMYKLNNLSLNNEWVNNKIKEEVKSYLETNENENTTI